MKQTQITTHAKRKSAPSKGKKRLRMMTITPGTKGGATVEHHFGPMDDKDPYGASHPSESHPFAKSKEVAGHVGKMLESLETGEGE